MKSVIEPLGIEVVLTPADEQKIFDTGDVPALALPRYRRRLRSSTSLGGVNGKTCDRILGQVNVRNRGTVNAA